MDLEVLVFGQLAQSSQMETGSHEGRGLIKCITHRVSNSQVFCIYNMEITTGRTVKIRRQKLIIIVMIQEKK